MYITILILELLRGKSFIYSQREAILKCVFQVIKVLVENKHVLVLLITNLRKIFFKVFFIINALKSSFTL